MDGKGCSNQALVDPGRTKAPEGSTAWFSYDYSNPIRYHSYVGGVDNIQTLIQSFRHSLHGMFCHGRYQNVLTDAARLQLMKQG